MSKVNPKVKKGLVETPERLAGGAGAIGAKQSNIAALKRVVMANLLWEKPAYVEGKTISDEIKRLIPLCDAKDVMDVILAAKFEQKLRNTPLFMTVEMLKYPTHKVYVQEILKSIITRPDMMTDFLALYKKEFNKLKTLPKPVKKGLAACFSKFDEYQFAKYNKPNEIKLRDVLFLTRPNPEDNSKAELFKKIADNDLKTPDTWEVALSSGANKKDSWERLLSEKKLGAQALLRNLRNMKDVGVSSGLIKESLRNISNSILLPIDFFKAASIAPEYKSDIEVAMLSSYSNLPKLLGKTLFIIDVSGSMSASVSGLSDFSRNDVASAMAVLAANQCEFFDIVATAGNDGTRIHKSELIANPEKGFGLISQIKKTAGKLGGGGIFTRQCLEWCYENVGKEYDRVIVFSDSQDCDRTNKVPNPFGKMNYICDVSNNKLGINYSGVWTAEISGWSEHFLTYISSIEGVRNTFETEE